MELKVEIRAVTPVHVGCGEEWTFEQYLVRESDGRGRLQVIDLPIFVSSLTADRKAAVMQALESGDILKIKMVMDAPWVLDWIDCHPKLTKQNISSSAKFLSHARGAKNRKENYGIIHQFYRSGTSLTLPGSSIKGSIRTAVLNSLLDERSVSNLLSLDAFKDRNRKGQQALLNYRDMKQDPFRALCIPDLPLGDESSYIAITKMIGGSSRQQEETLPVSREMMRSMESHGDAPVWTSIWNVKTELLGKKNHKGDPAISDFAGFFKDPLKIAGVCNDFFVPNIQKELAKFQSRHPVRLQFLPNFFRLPANECLIRVGRHSHVENVTMGLENGIAKPRTTRNKPFGTTRTYVDGPKGLLPLGWLHLKFV